MNLAQPVNRRDHWNHIYQTRAPHELSWFQSRPTVSLRLVEATGVAKDDPILDAGGGASVLVDCLLDAGFTRVAVLDISAAALQYARQRLGERAHRVEWFEADVTEFQPPHPFRLWHDRAVFHFLTDSEDRRKYVQTLERSLLPGGHVIVATFALDGPPKCSGLPVMRYDGAALCAELGPGFRLVQQLGETHVTPWRTEQKFSYFHFLRAAPV